LEKKKKEKKKKKKKKKEKKEWKSKPTKGSFCFELYTPHDKSS